MKILQHVKIFFQPSVIDMRSNSKPFYGVELFESIADAFLLPTYKLLRGKKIAILPSTGPEFCRDLIGEENFDIIGKSTILKVIFVVFSVIFFIPGLLFKLVAWGLDLSYRKEINNIILDFIEGKVLFPSREFARIEDPQNNSRVLMQAKDTLDRSFLYLNNKSLYAFARCSKLSYTKISNFAKEFLSVSPLFQKLLTPKEYSDLPEVKIPGEYLFLLDLVKQKNANFEEFMFTDFFNIEHEISEKNCLDRIIAKCYTDEPFVIKMTSRLAKSTFLGRPALVFNAQKPIFPGAPPLLMTIKGFAIVYFKNKPIILGRSFIDIQLLFFLNDLHFFEHNPIVEDYLKRLVKGEPCGIPSTKDKYPTWDNYATTRAANYFIEGPKHWILENSK
jgi:hypothetical protein